MDLLPVVEQGRVTVKKLICSSLTIAGAPTGDTWGREYPIAATPRSADDGQPFEAWCETIESGAHSVGQSILRGVSEHDLTHCYVWVQENTHHGWCLWAFAWSCRNTTTYVST